MDEKTNKSEALLTYPPEDHSQDQAEQGIQRTDTGPLSRNQANNPIHQEQEENKDWFIHNGLVVHKEIPEFNFRSLLLDIVDYSDGFSSVDSSKFRCCCFEFDCCGAFLFPIVCPVYTAYILLCCPIYCCRESRLRVKGPWVWFNCFLRHEYNRNEMLTQENIARHNIANSRV